MKPKEIRKEIEALQRKCGPRSEVSIHIANYSGSEQPAHLSIYPAGICGGARSISVEGDDWEKLLADANAAWAKHAATERTRVIRQMAVEIIKITADLGECTDAALRGEKFSVEEIVEYGKEAVAEADKLASNGPFKIVRAAKANAA